MEGDKFDVSGVAVDELSRDATALACNDLDPVSMTETMSSKVPPQMTFQWLFVATIMDGDQHARIRPLIND